MDIYIITNAIFYILLFIIGTLFGSFYTLAVYRIPKKQDITHTHSYCPNCNHKLGILDLIPVLSYIMLKGKCRYCEQKIRPRYLILEIISGFNGSNRKRKWKNSKISICIWNSNFSNVYSISMHSRTC